MRGVYDHYVGIDSGVYIAPRLKTMGSSLAEGFRGFRPKRGIAESIRAGFRSLM